MRDSIGADTGIVYSLNAIAENVKSIVSYVKIKDAGKYADENETKKIKNAIYQVEFYEKAIPIHKEDIGSAIKWEELVKPPAEGEGEENKP